MRFEEFFFVGRTTVFSLEHSVFLEYRVFLAETPLAAGSACRRTKKSTWNALSVFPSRTAKSYFTKSSKTLAAAARQRFSQHHEGPFDPEDL